VTKVTNVTARPLLHAVLAMGMSGFSLGMHSEV